MKVYTAQLAFMLVQILSVMATTIRCGRQQHGALGDMNLLLVASVGF